MSQSSLKKTIEVMLLFGVDNSKSAAIKKNLNDLAAKFEILQKEAEQTRKTISEMSEAGLPVEQLENHLADVESQLAGVAAEAKRANGELEQMNNNTAYNIRDIGQKLSQVGTAMQNAGNALLSPLQGALQAYMAQQQAIKDAGGTMSESAKKYLDAQKQMQEAYIRIGAVALEQLTPYIEDAADLLNKFADFVEQHPEIIEGIAKSGIALAVMGKFISAAGQIAMFAGAIQGLGLFAEGGLLAGAIPALIAAAPVIGTAIAAAIMTAIAAKGTFAGAAALENTFNADKYDRPQTAADEWVKFRQILATSTLGIATLGKGFDENTPKTWDAIKAFYGLGDSSDDASAKTAKTTEELLAEAEAAKKAADASAQLAKAYSQYQSESAEAQRSFEISKTKIAEDLRRAELDATRAHNQALSSIGARYKSQVESATASYRQAEAQSAIQYQASRAQTARDGAEEIRRIEQDHQKRLAELLASHNERMGDLTANRDAMGIAKEKQAYAKSVKDENSNTNAEIAQRRRDLAIKLQDMAQAYAAERAQRAQEYQQKLAEAAKQKQADLAEERQRYAETVRKNREEAQLKLRDLTQQFNEESRRRRAAFLASVNELAAEAGIKNKYHALMLKDVEAFMVRYRATLAQTNVNHPGRAGGGYTPLGVYQMGEKGTEFVLNADTTRAAEKMIGGNLSQDRMLAGLTRSQSSSASNQITLQQTIHFNGEDNAPNRAQLRTLIRSVALEAIGQVIPQR